MQKWITLPFGPRKKKEGGKERKRGTMSGRSVGRSVSAATVTRPQWAQRGSLARLFYAVISVRGTDATRTDTDFY